MKPYAAIALVIRLLACVCPLVALAAPSAWEQTSRGLFKDAHESFAEAKAVDARTRFGEAVTLLNLQPKTSANIDRAAALFEQVAADATAGDLAISARYYRARIEQLHRLETDLAVARTLYRELVALGSPHPLAQRALMQLALIELFEPGVAAETRRARFAEFAAAGEALTDLAARRDLHLVLGEAAQRFAFGDEVALEQLLAADGAGLVRSATQREVWVRIGELARVTGRDELAALYYRRFLGTFLRDSRRYTIEQRLAALAPAPAAYAP